MSIAFSLESMKMTWRIKKAACITPLHRFFENLPVTGPTALVLRQNCNFCIGKHNLLLWDTPFLRCTDQRTSTVIKLYNDFVAFETGYKCRSDNTPARKSCHVHNGIQCSRFVFYEIAVHVLSLPAYFSISSMRTSRTVVASIGHCRQA